MIENEQLDTVTMPVMPKAGHYQVILADPPWTFKTHSAKGKGRSAEAHYDCMTLTQLMMMPPTKWAADDCVLFMWTADPMLPQALTLIDAWGFTYKTTGFVWAKTVTREKVADRVMNWGTEGAVLGDRSIFPISTGYWTRANPEICLLATRGKPKRLSAAVRKLIVSPRREHSRKPDEAYERIEALCSGPYLELFARFPRHGWDSWGSGFGIEQRKWASNSHP